MQTVETGSYYSGYLPANFEWRGHSAANSKYNPAQSILILTSVESEQVIRDCLEAGVRGWVFKSDGTEDLTTAVEAMQRGKSIFSSRVSDLIVDGYKRHRVDPDAAKLPKLSPREREVVQLVSEGKASKEVAAILNVTLATAETHRSNIMQKLKLHSIAELVLYAVRTKLSTCNPHPCSAFPTPERNEVARVQLRTTLHFPIPSTSATTGVGASTENRSLVSIAAVSLGSQPGLRSGHTIPEGDQF